MKKLGLILFVLIIVYFIFLIRQDIIDNLELKREEQRVAVNIQKEEKLSKELQNKLKALKSSGYIERLARTRLGLIKKGEAAYKVINKE
jgi:cell division protein FtsB